MVEFPLEQKIKQDLEYEHEDLPERKRNVAPEQHVFRGFLPVAQTLGFTFLPQEGEVLGEILVNLRCTGSPCFVTPQRSNRDAWRLKQRSISGPSTSMPVGMF